jgi:hypothetical protein
MRPRHAESSRRRRARQLDHCTAFQRYGEARRLAARSRLRQTVQLVELGDIDQV